MSFALMATAANTVTFVLCPLSVLLLAYWAFKPGAKPAGDYDCDPLGRAGVWLERLDYESPEHVMRREQLRRMFRRAQTDDEVTEAIEWGHYALRLGYSEISEILDEVLPLGSDDQRAALAVRRMYMPGFSA